MGWHVLPSPVKGLHLHPLPMGATTVGGFVPRLTDHHPVACTGTPPRFDPEEADFFYVPIMMACFFDVVNWNKLPSWPKGFLGACGAPKGTLSVALAWCGRARGWVTPPRPPPPKRPQRAS